MGKKTKLNAINIWDLRITYKTSAAYTDYLKKQELLTTKTRTAALAMVYCSKDVPIEDCFFLAKLMIVDPSAQDPKAKRLVCKIYDRTLDLVPKETFAAQLLGLLKQLPH